jgi:hypothetical protein
MVELVRKCIIHVEKPAVAIGASYILWWASMPPLKGKGCPSGQPLLLYPKRIG